MSTVKIICLIAVLIGILLFHKTKPKFLQVLLVGFVLSFISSFFDRDLSFDFSFLSFGILNLIYFIYSAYNKSWLPASVSIFIFLSFIFKVQYWPYTSEIRAVMIVPIILFFIAIFNIKTYKNQISILTIIAAYAFSEFMQLLF